MATELTVVGASNVSHSTVAEVSLTQFCAGQGQQALQLTQGRNAVTLTAVQAEELAEALQEWAERQ